ncbi:MAG: hypothetical protein ACR2Q4_06425, partial [Geminicoccaceae bacterium]
LGTAALACGSAALTTSVLAGDERGLSHARDAGTSKAIEAPRDLSPVMKNLIGAHDDLDYENSPPGMDGFYDDSWVEDYDDDDVESTDPEDFETEEFNAGAIAGQVKAQAAYA